MKSASKSIRTLALTLALTLGAITTGMWVSPQGAIAAERDAKKVSEKVGKPLKAAQEAIARKQFDLAFAKIREAQAEKKTAFEEFQINESLAYLYSNEKKYEEVGAIYEKSLEHPDFLAADQADARVKTVAQLAFQNKQYSKVSEYTKRWLRTHPNDQEMTVMLGNSYYMTKDYRQAREVMNGLIAQAEKNGEAPKEVWLQLVNTCSTELDDSAGIVAALEKLVRYYPKADYWERLLDRASRNERADRVMFQWFRLEFDAGAMKRDDQFMEYAQLASDANLYGEMLRVVETGFEKKILGADEKKKERHTRLLNTAKQKAQADKAQLPQLEKEAQASKVETGQLDAGLGLVYFGYEMYDQAILALERGIKKGGLKNVEDYKIALGIAQLHKGQKETARSTFRSIPASSPLAKVASMWALRTFN